MKVAQSAQQDREKGQMGLFGAVEDMPITQGELADAPEWSHADILRNEKEQLGFYLSGHPLQQYGDIMKYYTTVTSQTLSEPTNGTEVYAAGQLVSVRLTKTKKGDPMAILVIEDLEGTTDVVVFPEAYKKSRDAIEEDAVVWIRGNVSENRRKNGGNDDEIEEATHQIQAEEILPIDTVVERLTSAVEVTISESDTANQQKLEELQNICSKGKGDHNLIIRLLTPKYGEVIAQCNARYNISYPSQTVSEIEALFGNDSVKPSNRTTRVGEKSSSMSYVE
jgi:DNA polymerase-3 subunit alpha